MSNVGGYLDAFDIAVRKQPLFDAFYSLWKNDVSELARMPKRCSPNEDFSRRYRYNRHRLVQPLPNTSVVTTVKVHYPEIRKTAKQPLAYTPKRGR